MANIGVNRRGANCVGIAQMRAKTHDRSSWVRFLGTLFVIVLPIVVVSNIQSHLKNPATIWSFILSFLLVSLGAQAGLILRRWGKIRLGQLLLDLSLALVAGGASFGVVRLAVARGGGAIDPSLVAVVMAYLLVIWSGQGPEGGL